ncbi:putative bactericidal permeability-increasing protein, partial [Apostichopus japonicus]
IIPLIPDVMSLDLSLTANPASTESFLDILHSGEIFDVNSRSKPSQDKPAFPSDSEDSQMFYIWLTDYGLNSAGQTLFSSGYLHYSLTQKELPENNTLQLNTSGYEISLLLPQISKSYPNKEIQFKIYPSSPPSVQLTEEAVELQVQINIELHIIQDDSTTDNVATLQTVSLTKVPVSHYCPGVSLVSVVDLVTRFALHSYITNRSSQYGNHPGGTIFYIQHVHLML